MFLNSGDKLCFDLSTAPLPSSQRPVSPPLVALESFQSLVLAQVSEACQSSLMAVVCVLNFLELGFLCQGTRPLKHRCRHGGELCGKEQAGTAENSRTPLGDLTPEELHCSSV